VLLLVAHPELKNLDPRELAKLTPARTAIDLVNGWDKPRWQAAGFQLYRLGDGSLR